MTALYLPPPLPARDHPRIPPYGSSPLTLLLYGLARRTGIAEPVLAEWVAGTRRLGRLRRRSVARDLGVPEGLVGPDAGYGDDVPMSAAAQEAEAVPA